ncbi:MAG: aminotransferase class I/II-fold pyridoxal phosphate-dependent enzyme [Jatrophihabitans sp.]
MRVFEAAQARAARGLPVFNLAAGQPGTPAPVAVREAAKRAVDEQLVGYTSALGIQPLREAIAGHYHRTYGIGVRPDEVVVTTGSSGAFLLAFLAAFDVGDTVVLARPGYPSYRNMLAALGCTVVELPCGAESRFQPTVQMLDALPNRPAGLVLASPANPTGTMVNPTELAAIARWCGSNGVRLISDEIYHGVTYTGQVASAWGTDRSGVVVNSFSKYWRMTGWRLGWLLAPADLRDAIDRLTTNFTLCPPTLSQHAAIAAFDDYADLDAAVEQYRGNRTLALDGLAAAGLSKVAPADGAFYVYADVGHLTDDSLTLCYRILDETGVACAPGLDFDPIDGCRRLRFSFAGDRGTLTAALEALAGWLPRA